MVDIEIFTIKVFVYRIAGYLWNFYFNITRYFSDFYKIKTKKNSLSNEKIHVAREVGQHSFELLDIAHLIYKAKIIYFFTIKKIFYKSANLCGEKSWIKKFLHYSREILNIAITTIFLVQYILWILRKNSNRRFFVLF